MRILIDADGCPVVDETIAVAKEKGAECLIICDTSHEFSRDGARTIVVEKGSDSVDFALVNLLQKGDIVITQDYGLAALCLAKGGIPISQDGVLYTDDNIDALLGARHFAAKVRRGGGRLRGNKKRTKEQDERFVEELMKLTATLLSN